MYFTYKMTTPLWLTSLMYIEMRVLELICELVKPLKRALTALLTSGEKKKYSKFYCVVCNERGRVYYIFNRTKSCPYFFLFLVASTRLYKPLRCRSVGRSVRR